MRLVYGGGLVPAVLRAQPDRHAGAGQPRLAAVGAVEHDDLAVGVRATQVHLPPLARPGVRVRVAAVRPRRACRADVSRTDLASEQRRVTARRSFAWQRFGCGGAAPRSRRRRSRAAARLEGGRERGGTFFLFCFVFHRLPTANMASPTRRAGVKTAHITGRRRRWSSPTRSRHATRGRRSEALPRRRPRPAGRPLLSSG